MSEANDKPLARLVAAHPGIWANDAVFISSLPPGWCDLVDRALTDIEKLCGDGGRAFKVEQLKEKYSTLRLYYSLHGRTRLNIDVSSPAGRVRLQQRSGNQLSQAIDERISEAEAESARTCERCGAPGRRRDAGGWLTTLCDEHARQVTAEEDNQDQ